ncbi:hypothetical protein [Edaphobacter aggregans]|uniref:hypothetical protein n=1 Tax=Edaphobacter aggregans TaxID=570835 RepID=UPI0012FC0910|nr:hypothetical protein [Edaphobacter aggregans]
MPSVTPAVQPEVHSEPNARSKSRRIPLSLVACTRCGGYHTARTRRRTFLQREVLFRLGYFPWKCIDCANRFLSKDRGHY